MDFTIYTRPDCPFCTMAQQLAVSRGGKPTVIDITQDPDTWAWFHKQGFRTVPQVFVDGVHVGGYEDLQAYLRNTEESDRA